MRRVTLLFLLALPACAALAKLRRVPEVNGPNPATDGAELAFNVKTGVSINCSDAPVLHTHVLSGRDGQLCYQIVDYGYTGHPPVWPEVRLRNPKGAFLTIPMRQSAGPDDLGECPKRLEWRYARYQYDGCAPAAGFIDPTAVEITTVTKNGDVDWDFVRWRFAASGVATAN
jgi:hypothetical protein